MLDCDQLGYIADAHHIACGCDVVDLLLLHCLIESLTRRCVGGDGGYVESVSIGWPVALWLCTQKYVRQLEISAPSQGDVQVVDLFHKEGRVAGGVFPWSRVRGFAIINASRRKNQGEARANKADFRA